MIRLKNNSFIKYTLVVFLSITHVCLSAYTPNNGANPLLLLMLVTYSLWSEFITYYIGGFMIQGIVTSFLAFLILDWKNVKLWLMCLAIGLCLQTFLCEYYINYHSQIIQLSCINEFQQSIGMIFYVNNIIFFTISQILLIILYPINRYIVFKFNTVRPKNIG